MKRLLTLLTPLALVFAVTAAVLPATSTTFALDPAKEAQEGVQGAGGGRGGEADLKSAIQTVINVLLFIIGAVSVIMIIIGGLRYVISNGDQGQVTSAKNTILYAVVGLVVALLAFAIVNFVISAFI